MKSNFFTMGCWKPNFGLFYSLILLLLLSNLSEQTSQQSQIRIDPGNFGCEVFKIESNNYIFAWKIIWNFENWRNNEVLKQENLTFKHNFLLKKWNHPAKESIWLKIKNKFIQYK